MAFPFFPAGDPNADQRDRFGAERREDDAYEIISEKAGRHPSPAAVPPGMAWRNRRFGEID
jgi:hypothetical protein